MKRRVCIELPKQDPEANHHTKLGKLTNTVCGTGEASHIWGGGEVRRETVNLGLHISVPQPPLCSKLEKDDHLAARVDDFLCIGPWSELESIFTSLKKPYDLKSTMVRWGCRT